MTAKPKSPTPRSVSATLVAADFRTYRDGRDEGYLTEWHEQRGSGPVRVNFETGDADVRKLALEKMAAVLARKWSVQDVGYLIVNER